MLATFLVAAVALQSQKIDGIEKLVTAFMAKNNVSGVSISVVVDGQLAWSKGYGFADLENRVPATVETAYRSASIGKTMTATAAMILGTKGSSISTLTFATIAPPFPRSNGASRRGISSRTRAAFVTTADREIRKNSSALFTTATFPMR